MKIPADLANVIGLLGLTAIAIAAIAVAGKDGFALALPVAAGIIGWMRQGPSSPGGSPQA